jgi:anti-sigma regulatory factor (Ser/Thr protein kinase)
MEKRVLIGRWLGSYTHPIPIYDEASVSSARQLVREVGQRLNLNNEVIERVALIASELTHNQLAHARQGYFAVKPVERQGVGGLEITAADMGPGIGKPAQAIASNIPTNNSLGAGLGAVLRAADEVEFDNRLSEGVRITARKFENPAAHLWCEVAIMGKPYPGEIISGDDAAYFQSESQFLAAVCDGLGHGPEARKASNRAIEVLADNQEADLDQIVTVLNRELAGTRGCAMNLVRLDKMDRTIECASFGDVHSHLYTLRDAHFFPSTPFILGDGDLAQRRIRVETEPAEPRSVLVMFTDGLKSRTTLKGQLDILRQPVIAIAQHLLENDSRPDDDVLILVARLMKKG